MNNFDDLHTHSAHSREADNFLDIRLRDYIRAKKEMQLKIVGLVDHDTLNHLEPMYRAKRLFDPNELPLIIPGIEITSAFAHPTRKGKVVQTHVLGYFPSLIDKDENKLKRINEIMEPIMSKALEGKLKKNLDIRLQDLFKTGIIPKSYDFNSMKAKMLQKYEQDKEYMESKEPKKGDIINWPLNSSIKIAVDTLLEEKLISCAEEGGLYLDRVSDDKMKKLAKILAAKESITEELALEKAKKLQGCCHGDYNDDYYKLSTQDAISWITKAGGIPVLAHPMISLKSFKDDEKAFFAYCKDELISCGLNGMEAFYPKQDTLTPRIIDFCRKNGIYITGGSDDHQDGRNHIGEPGSRCPVEYIKEMVDV